MSEERAIYRVPQDPCPECHGEGEVPDNEHYVHLWGHVIPSEDMAFRGVRVCRVCRGDGRVTGK